MANPAERERISDYIRWDMIRHLVKAGRSPYFTL